MGNQSRTRVLGRRWLITGGAVVAAVGLVAGLAFAGDLPPGGTFTDDDGTTHEGSIEAIAAEEITRGCNPPTNDLFCPGGTVTRRQMAAFLVRALGLTDRLDNPFIDDNGSIFEADIERLAAAGITRGCNPPDNDRFCPEGRVTRGAMAAFLVRAFGYSDDGGGDLFVDDDGSVFEGDIDRFATAGVTKGCNPPTNDRFCPGDPVTRGQMATFLTRALGLTPMVPPPPTGTTTTTTTTTTMTPPAGELTIRVLAVRQGSAALYEGPCGEVGLIDANRFRSAEVLAGMDSLGSRDLAWISVSHYDADHLGAIVDVATAAGVTVGAVYDRGGSRTVKDSATYRGYYDWVTGAGLRKPVDIADVFTLCAGPDQVTFTVVSAGTDGTAAGGVAVSEENDRGLCLHVEFRDFDLATCGDVNGTDAGSRTNVESAVAAAMGDVEFAVINHHGSTFSSNAFYVTTLSAQASVISVGKNSFGHPDATVVARWDAQGDVYQTQSAADNAIIDGDVTVITDGSTGFTVTTQGGASSSYVLDP